MEKLLYSKRKQTCPIPFGVGAVLLMAFFWISLFSGVAPLFANSPLSRTILSVEVTGNTLLRQDQINEVIAPFIGKDLSLNELNRIVSAMTETYRRNRFFMVKVSLPAQEIKAGRVQVAVLEGQVGSFSVTGNQFYNTSFIEKHFVDSDIPAGAGPPPSLEWFKRATLLLNDYPDLKAELLFKPGMAIGTADLEVVIKDEQPIHALLDYNNFGSKAVSRYRFGIGFEMGNLIEDGHNLSSRFVVGSPVHDLTYYQGKYTAPLGYTGKKGHLTYARGNFDVANLNANIKTESVGLSVSYPFLKTHLQALSGEIGFEANNVRQTILQSRDRIRVLRGKAHYKRFAEGTRDFLSITLSQGLGSFLGGTENDSLVTSRPGADDLFTKATVDWVRVRSIPQPYFIPHRHSLIIAGAAQVSSDSLVVSEQFLVGGGDSVRGYPFGEFLGDDGYFVSSELRVSPFTDPKKIQTAIFLDHGGSFTKQSSAGGTHHSLTGVGFGVRFNFPGTITLQELDSETETPGYFIDYRFQIRADVGFPVGDRAVSQQGRSPIFYLQAIGRF